MPMQQFQFDFAPRTKMRVSEAIRLLKKFQVFTSPPSRETVVDLILDGTLDGRKIGEMWFVYADSFETWVKSLDEPEQMRRAA